MACAGACAALNGEVYRNLGMGKEILLMAMLISA